MKRISSLIDEKDSPVSISSELPTLQQKKLEKMDRKLSIKAKELEDLERKVREK